MIFIIKGLGLFSSSLVLFPQRLWPKRCENKDEENSPKTLNDENHQDSSQNFR